ncbi:hypothetical protein VNO78_00266 [Psophocarpus tetragonolobus]|uniref:Uncharacterized protein n=1 Tax=Psophocarpus tetragonolobus TaxID=3891 RepID=A0AAN9SZ67_PSOTE
MKVRRFVGIRIEGGAGKRSHLKYATPHVFPFLFLLNQYPPPHVSNPGFVSLHVGLTKRSLQSFLAFCPPPLPIYRVSSTLRGGGHTANRALLVSLYPSVRLQQFAMGSAVKGFYFLKGGTLCIPLARMGIEEFSICESRSFHF